MRTCRSIRWSLAVFVSAMLVAADSVDIRADTLSAVTLRCANTQAAPTPIGLRVAVVLDTANVPAQLDQLLDQASRIWQAYGVTLQWKRANGAGLTPRDVDVWAYLTDWEPARRGGAGPRRPLGAIQFLDGRPQNVVRISRRAAGRLAQDTLVGGESIASQPPHIYDRFIAHAMGRALAHEIGHFLLGTSAHSRHGLMRQSHSSAELLGTSLDGFALERGQAEAFASRWLEGCELV
jgi:hypothetical protein